MPEISTLASDPEHAKRPISLGSALFISVLIALGLGALALWPTPAWSPPPRPRLNAPIVFDEFVNPAPPAPVSSQP